MGQPSPAELLTFLKKAHDDFQSLAEKPTFNKMHAQHRTIMSLYGTIFELTGSCIVLIDKKLISGIPILIRSILEAYVDLHNLVQNPTYGFHIEAKCLLEWLNLLKAAKDGQNMFLSSLQNIPDSAYVQLKAQSDELAERGYHPLSHAAKFKRAGLEQEYKSIYNMLCCDSHNNMRSLIARHIKQEEDDFSVVIYKDNTLQDSAMNIALITDYFIKASEIVHDFLKSPASDTIRSYRDTLNNLCTETSQS